MPRTPSASRATPRKSKSEPLRATAPSRLLELFYPIYYKVGYAIANTLRSGSLTRQQAAILWLIHSEGTAGRSMRRKEVERLLRDWFEVTNSAISKALRALSRPPHELLTLAEDPNSGREKRIHLTPKGIEYVDVMMKNGREHCAWIAARLSDQDLAAGIRFMASVSEIAREWPGNLEDARRLVPKVPKKR